MITINNGYEDIVGSYLFADIRKKIFVFQKKNPEINLIKLGIGDVNLPLAPACIEAFHSGVSELGYDKSFRGYGPINGYDFLRKKISNHDYKNNGINISPEEIFISDGSKCDIANIQELFDIDVTVGIPDPVYPVYLDTNVMAGRAGNYLGNKYSKIVYLNSTQKNGFVPDIPEKPIDLIYLCFPNNPTGATISRKKLKEWVDFARKNKSLILYDAAYESFIQDDSLPRSIYEIDGSDEVAIEFRSFSKKAGFTGVRCAYTVVPKNCIAYSKDGKKHYILKLWNRRQSTKFNGVSYPVQRAAEAVYSDEGSAQIKEMIKYYMDNARFIRNSLENLNLRCTGGINSPYIWISVEMDSWSFFDFLLEKAGVVCTPGEGFGNCGKNYIRITAFNSRENINEAIHKICNKIKKK